MDVGHLALPSLGGTFPQVMKTSYRLISLLIGRVSDPHFFCASGSGQKSSCGSGSGSWGDPGEGAGGKREKMIFFSFFHVSDDS